MRALLALLCAALAATELTADASRPNLVLFLVDDLGWRDVSLPLHTGETELERRYRTPNLERLAARGVRFTDAYAASPVCTPTRTAILTGAHPARTRVTYWTLRGDTSAEHASLLPPEWNWNGLAAEEGEPRSVHRPTLPALLRERGYRTIHVGKAHFGAIGTSGADPTRLGFDVNVAGHAAGAPGSYLAEHGYSAAHRGGSRDWDVSGLEAHAEAGRYLTEALAREAVAAVAAALDDERPFFLHFAPYAVHTPIEANPARVAHYAEAGLPPVEAAYASMIESADAALGDVLDLLDRRGATEDTWVLFFSDNGGLSAHGRAGARHRHNAPLKSGKGSAYEGGVRVPLVVRKPGVTPAGAVVSEPVHAVDLFPTLLAAAGVPPGALEGVALDGVDLTARLAGGPPLPERGLFWHHPHQWGVAGPGIEPFSSIRRGRWKLIHFYAGPRVELYDLEADLGEARDLAADEPDRATELSLELGRWLASVGAQMPRAKGSGADVPLPGAE